MTESVYFFLWRLLLQKIFYNPVVEWGVARKRFSAKNRAKLNSMSTRTNHACEGKEEGEVGGGTVCRGRGQGEGAPA